MTNTTTSTSGGAASSKSGVSVIDMQHPGAESEVAVACSMSPLLAELFNGKLASTISLFCRRAVAESSGRQWRGVGGGGGGACSRLVLRRLAGLPEVLCGEDSARDTGQGLEGRYE